MTDWMKFIVDKAAEQTRSVVSSWTDQTPKWINGCRVLKVDGELLIVEESCHERIPVLSDAARRDPRQASYEIKRRAFQAEQGRVIKRMTGGKW